MLPFVAAVSMDVALADTDRRSASEVWVSAQHGSDTSGSGTRAAPFLTLPRAQAAARSLPKPVRVRIQAGSYHLQAPLRLTAADGSSSEPPKTLT